MLQNEHLKGLLLKAIRMKATRESFMDVQTFLLFASSNPSKMVLATFL